MDHCYILMSLHLKYFLNWAMCSIYISQSYNMFFLFQCFCPKTRVHDICSWSKKSKKYKLLLSISSKNWILPKITLTFIEFSCLYVFNLQFSSFACLSNCCYFKLCKCQFPSISGYNNLKWCIPTSQRTNFFFQSLKKKLPKDKVIPNHIEQNWDFDMVNFEIDFLSNHN